MGVGFDGGLDPEVGEGFGGFGADGGDAEVGVTREQGRQGDPGVQVGHGGAAGEGEPVGALVEEGGDRGLGGVGFGHRTVERDVIDDGAAVFELAAEFRAGDLGTSEEHAQILQAFLFFDGVGDGLSDEFVGDGVDAQVEFADTRGGGGADGGEAEVTDRAQVFEGGEQAVEEGVDPIDAGEDHPVVFAETGEGFDHGFAFGGVRDADGGDFEDFGAEVGEAAGEFTGLFAGTGDDDATAEERAGFEPAERAAQSDDLADDRDGGGTEAVLACAVGDVGDVREPAVEGLLSGQGSVTDEGDGGLGGLPGGEQAGGDVGEAFEAHEHDLGTMEPGNLGPIDRAFRSGGVFVAGDDGEGGGVLAVGEGDAGVGGDSGEGGDTGNHFEGDAGVGEGFGFLAAAAEDVGISAF